MHTKSKYLILTTIIMLFSVTSVFAHSSGTRTFVKSTGNNISGSDFTYTPNITGKASIESITVHFATQATDEDIRIILDSELGATYDTVIATSDSVTINDFFWIPDSPFYIEKNDNIRIFINSASGAETEAFTITIRGEYL